MSTRAVFRVGGMTCAACAARIEKGLRRLEGVTAVQVNLMAETACVEFREDALGVETIAGRIEAIGYEPRLANEAADGEEEERTYRLREAKRMKRELALAAVCALPLVLSMLARLPFASFFDFLQNPWLQFALATPVQFVAGRSFYSGAYYALRNRAPNMDVLIALGTTAAYVYSVLLAVRWTLAPGDSPMLYFETGALLVLFVKAGKWLEWSSKGKTGAALGKLKRLQAPFAALVRETGESRMPVGQLMAGDRVRVRPGERIALDGIVEEGASYVDEAVFTGESMPTFKSKGDKLLGGAINGNGTMIFQVTHDAGRSLLARMVRAVEEGQLSKPRIQRLADTVSEYFVQMIVCLAVMTFVIWFVWLDPRDGAHALEAALSVLVVACPCAFGLAAPAALTAGMGRAAEFGILFRRGEALETLHKTNTVVFDKTGTLTLGRPVVTAVKLAENSAFGQAELRRLAASVEQGSEHPLARAIAAEAEALKLKLAPVRDFAAVPGMGVRGESAGTRILLGSAAFMRRSGIEIAGLVSAAERWENEGQTVVWMAAGGRCAGIMAIADELKPEAAEVVLRLRRMGRQVVMLTGDSERVAQAVARRVGIEEVIAGVLPDGKAEVIGRLRKRKRRIVMVGDGVNDAPALAKAHCGIALKSGTDIAIEAADIVLVHNSLHRVADALRIGAMTMDTIKTSLTWSLVYNGIGIPLAMSGLLMPWMAGAAMALSSVAVVWNALRLRRIALDSAPERS